MQVKIKSPTFIAVQFREKFWEEEWKWRKVSREEKGFYMRTFYGRSKIYDGDWVVTGKDGTSYVYREDIFDKIFDKVQTQKYSRKLPLYKSKELREVPK